MRRLVLATVGFLMTSAPVTSGVAEADGVRVPVVVELFSSEGCSSCPPADTLLARLDRDQPIAGVQVVALELHVDYWNQLGWTDSFSQAAFSARQRMHAHAMGSRGLYTPQMVVDGRSELVGSNATGATLAIEQAARAPHVSVKITRRSNDAIFVEASAPPQSEGASHVVLATTERGLRTIVTSGENAGETLAHGPITHTLRYLGDVGAAGFSGQVQQPFKSGTRVVVFVEGRDSLHVLGAATVD
jgi:hypothetical protein